MRKILTAFFALLYFVPSVYAGGTLSLMGIGPASNIVLPSFTYNATLTTTVSSTTNSVTGISVGSPDASRIVVMAVTCAFVLNGSIASGTINGTPATLVRSTQGTGASAPRSAAAIFYLALPSGPTTNFSVSGAQLYQGCVFASYSLYHLNSATPVHSCGAQTTCVLTTQADGIAIGNANTYAGTVTYVSGLGATSDYSTSANNSVARGSSIITPSTSRTPLFSYGGTLNSASITAVSWR